MLPKVIELCAIVATYMTKPVLFKSLLIFAAIALLETACCVIDTCGCGNTEGSTRYRIKGYDIATYDGNNLITVTNQSVLATNLRLVLTPSHEFISADYRSFKGLYACSPPEPAPTQNILSFNITSEQNFLLPNTTIEAGESLNSVFFLSNGPYGEGQLESFLASPNIDASLYEYSLRIFQSIIQEQRHLFSIEVTLSDNQKYVFKTPALLLQP